MRQINNIILEEKEDLETETKKRLDRLKEEFSQEPILRLFENQGYDQIIAQIKIPFSALCEHHHIAFEGECSIAYIPNEYLVGLSKFGRVVEYFLNPITKTTQEKATHFILKYLEKTLLPKGLMVIIKAKHSCVCYRGVKKPSLTITSAVSGIFQNDTGARQEFLALIK